MIELKTKPLLVIISAPSGAGKTTIVREVLKKDSSFCLSISFTTRKMREGEIDGKDYYFISRDEFNAKIKNGDFIEYAEICGNLYGTCHNDINEKISSNISIILDINWEGAAQIMEKINYNFLSIFILPPSMKILYERLKNRGADDNEEIHKRLLMAKNEMNYYHIYDYLIINDNLDLAVKNVINIIESFRYLRKNKVNLWSNIKYLIDESI